MLVGYTLGAPEVTWRYVAVETISREELEDHNHRTGDERLVVYVRPQHTTRKDG